MDNQPPNQPLFDTGSYPMPPIPKITVKPKTKNKMNLLKLTKKQAVILLAAVIVLMFIATLIAVPNGANDPLNLIEYTPEQEEALASNSFKWQGYQTEIENHEMLIVQLKAEQNKLKIASEEIRRSVKNRIQPVPFQ